MMILNKLPDKKCKHILKGLTTREGSIMAVCLECDKIIEKKPFASLANHEYCEHNRDVRLVFTDQGFISVCVECKQKVPQNKLSFLKKLQEMQKI